MDKAKVNRDTLPQAVDVMLSRCLEQLASTSDPITLQDLTVAVQALQLIRDELTGVRPPRPKGQRSAVFIRYAIDSNDELAIDSDLKEIIVKIEDVYKRFEYRNEK